jgi:hypothetical protein
MPQFWSNGLEWFQIRHRALSMSTKLHIFDAVAAHLIISRDLDAGTAWMQGRQRMEEVMSVEESRENDPGRERWERSQQSAHWREIGISAVAAAALYSYDKPAVDVPAKGDAKADDAKVVTIRDIEYFAA